MAPVTSGAAAVSVKGVVSSSELGVYRVVDGAMRQCATGGETFEQPMLPSPPSSPPAAPIQCCVCKDAIMGFECKMGVTADACASARACARHSRDTAEIRPRYGLGTAEIQPQP